ncbi:hypothetical protein AAGV28_04395 [Flavobacterium sp. FZUC8N2.13]|uniref:Uncharacterized protein n=1 Tax=Flavobacterium zubiriense TaxID=3138075 RepID=A0ABV4T912_9FLAO
MISIEGGAQGGGSGLPPPNGLPVEPPPGFECCEDLAPASGQEEDASDEYKACMEDPAAYCTVPIANSISIYALMATGFALASFVVIRKIKKQKTPM